MHLKNPATLAANATEHVVAIVYKDAVFHLRKPITLDVHQESGFWVHEYEPLGISAYGETEEESLHAFAEEFSSCWHWIAEEGDRKLAADAKRLKQKLLDLVARVEPADEFFSH